MQSSNFIREVHEAKSGRHGVVLDEVSRIIAALLQLDPQEISVHEPFTEMGADSIGMALIRQVRTKFGVEVSIRQLFEGQNSVHALASYIERAQQGSGFSRKSGLQESVLLHAAEEQIVEPQELTKPFVPYNPIKPSDIAAPSASEQTKAKHLIERYTAKTRVSRQLTERYRPRLADNRASAGFRFSIKEMLYPLHAERSQGSKFYDVDG